MDQGPLKQTSVINGERENRIALCYIKEMSEANLLIPPAQLKLFNRIGQGSYNEQNLLPCIWFSDLPTGEFGIVYKGSLNDGRNEAKESSIVAVKTLKGSNNQNITNIIF